MDDPRAKRGYERVAAYMAWDPAQAIFARFRSANTLALLMLQAEIAQLEEEYSDAVAESLRSDKPEERGYGNDWSALKEHGKDSKQWQKAKALKDKVAEYSMDIPPKMVLSTKLIVTKDQALVNIIALQRQHSPSSYNLKFLRTWMDHSAGSRSELRGPGSLLYTDLEARDLLAISAQDNLLTEITSFNITKVLSWLPVQWFTSRIFLPEEGLDTVRMFGTQAGFEAVANLVSCLSAAILILVPVIVLNFVDTANMRLLTIVLFSLVFTVVMTTVTDARRGEVFAATAAFVAVQVVYVGSAIGQQPNQQASLSSQTSVIAG